MTSLFSPGDTEDADQGAAWSDAMETNTPTCSREVTEHDLD